MRELAELLVAPLEAELVAVQQVVPQIIMRLHQGASWAGVAAPTAPLQQRDTETAEEPPIKQLRCTAALAAVTSKNTSRVLLQATPSQ